MSFAPQLRALFPQDVVTADLHGSGDVASLHPDELSATHGFAAKRIAEFAAGRSCARRALKELGYAGVALLPNADRTARFPAGVVGSITHTDGYCAVSVARAARFDGIGLDAELVGRVTPETWPQLFTSDELVRLERSEETNRGALATIVFSAKETFYKCQFLLTQEWVDFQDVAIELVGPVPGEGSFTVRPVRALPHILGERPLQGRFYCDTVIVLTGMAFAKTEH